jgi:hypothetical protein
LAQWLVVAGEVDGQLAEDLAGGGVDDADFEVVDQEDDGVRAWVRPSGMWRSLPATRRVTVPQESRRSRRTRSWDAACCAVVGLALGVVV